MQLRSILLHEHYLPEMRDYSGSNGGIFCGVDLTRSPIKLLLKGIQALNPLSKVQDTFQMYPEISGLYLV